MGLLDDLSGYLSKADDTLYQKSDIYHGLKDAFTAPGRAWRGQMPSYTVDEDGTLTPSAQPMMDAMNTAGMMVGGSVANPAGGAGVLGSGAIKMRIGPNGEQIVAPKPVKSRQTVMDPVTMAFPGIYKNPRELVAGARVAPEDPIMQQLFGVTRDDLYQISQEGTRQGTMTERPFAAAPKAKGARIAPQVTNPRNTNRMIDIISEARERPDLFKGMASWYTMDPAYQRLVQLVGPDEAAKRYTDLNAFTSMSSPNSEVMTELNRGTGANWLANEGRFDDFLRYAGMSDDKRGSAFPDDMRAIQGHMAHKTAHSVPMGKYVSGGLLDMSSAKVPTYFHASGVPETGFQTAWPVGDAHWSRLVGLPDVRGFSRNKETGFYEPNAASASVPEMVSLGPWWRDKVAAPSGLESVPAQAVVWGAGSNATGVTSPIGAPKLELFSQSIAKAAKRMGVSPETARDMILMGRAHGGFADPALLGATALGAGALGYGLLNDGDQ
jgi:hypothetical protein